MYDVVKRLKRRLLFSVWSSVRCLFCLLNMFENWLSSLDQPDHYLRICYLDFSKAFDNTDHNVLVKKFIDLGVRRSLIAWLCSFYSDRRQAVKFNSLISDWELCRDGIPQGTKLGPILFAIMIDDLAVKSPPTAYHWKFVVYICLYKYMFIYFF